MEKLIAQKKNVLLAKDDVGKSKPTTRELPPDGFSYGKPDKKDQESAGVITQSWKAHEQSKPNDPPRDFKKLNKIGLKNGVVDAKVRMIDDLKTLDCLENEGIQIVE